MERVQVFQFHSLVSFCSFRIKGKTFFIKEKKIILNRKTLNAMFIRKKNYSCKVELYSSIATVPFKINTFLAFIARDRMGSFTNPTFKF